MRSFSSPAQLPLFVLLLMACISIILSERVLNHLSESQEEYLLGLSSTYVDGLSASVIPAVLREDNWEIFDTLERMSPKDIKINLVEAIVTNNQNIVLASNQPHAHPTLSELPDAFIDQFVVGRAILDEDRNLGFRVRTIFHHDQEIGKIYATFDASPFLEERRSVFYTLLFTNLALTLLVASIGYCTVRLMVAPMRVLERHFLDAARGELNPIPQKEFPSQPSYATSMFHAFNHLVEAERERAKLVDKLSREEQLANLGRLASGIAHEINNPLGGLLNATDTLEKHGEKPATRESSIKLIRRGLLSIRDIVTAVLAVYRPERDDRALTLQDFDDIALLLKPELQRHNIQLTLNIKTNETSFEHIPAGPVRQVLMNLTLNAISASPPDHFVRIEFVEQDNNYRLSVSDAGSGMAEAPRAILEAVDLTELPDNMSGLGLWIVREICSDLNATLSLEEEQSVGTTISILFPKTGEEPYDAA